MSGETAGDAQLEAPDQAPLQPRWLDADEQDVWRSVIAMVNLLPVSLEKALQPHGLTLHDYEILVRLSEAPERRLRLSELAGLSQQSKSRLSHQMTRMENAGLVRRESCDTDRRGAFAVMTDEGWRRLVASAPTHVESVRVNVFDQLDWLTAEQAQALRGALGAIAGHLLGEDGGGTCPSRSAQTAPAQTAL